MNKKIDDFEFRSLRLDKNDEIALKSFAEEFISRGERLIPSSFASHSPYSDWFKLVKKHSLGIDLPSNRVKSDLFFLIRKSDQRILGAIDIRHRLNEDLLNFGGNIGYGVRPSERRKGYASLMLSLALEKCREFGMDQALITCNKSNTASAKTIQKHGGVLEDERVDSDGTIKQRYWIKL